MLTWALKDGKIVHVDDVDNGAACGCVCPECGGALCAKNNGKIRAHYFSHLDDSARICEWAPESALHLLAKEIASEAEWMMFPALYAERRKTGREVFLSKAQKVRIARVELEKRVGSSIVPDIIITADFNGKLREFIVEIYVAHKCDEEKIQAIRKAGISAIEIDLNGFDRDTTKESLRNILIDEESYKRWIYNRKAALFEEHDQYGMPEAKKLPGVVVYDADDIAHGLVSTPRGQGKVMPYCPFTTPNLHYGHCETCPYCIDVTYGSSTRWYDVPVYVYCHPPDNQGKGN